jgi:hypothetical protein
MILLPTNIPGILGPSTKTSITKGEKMNRAEKHAKLKQLYKSQLTLYKEYKNLAPECISDENPESYVNGAFEGLHAMHDRLEMEANYGRDDLHGWTVEQMRDKLNELIDQGLGKAEMLYHDMQQSDTGVGIRCLMIAGNKCVFVEHTAWREVPLNYQAYVKNGGSKTEQEWQEDPLD